MIKKDLKKPVAFLLLFAVLIVVAIGLLPWMAVRTDTLIHTPCKCYDYEMIKDYGESHPYCNTEYYNDTKYNYFVSPGDECFTYGSGRSDATCPTYKCIQNSIINVGATDVRFELCYKNNKESFQKIHYGSDCGGKLSSDLGGYIVGTATLAGVIIFTSLGAILQVHTIMNKINNPVSSV